jgi:V-type H+-transporting ATPase subunit a
MDKASIPMRSIYEFNNVTSAPSASEIDELADRCHNLENRVSSLNESYETLKKREVELTEWRWVLREAGGFFDRVGLWNGTISASANMITGKRTYRRHSTIH